jgi:hypothetical protein
MDKRDREQCDHQESRLPGLNPPRRRGFWPKNQGTERSGHSKVTCSTYRYFFVFGDGFFVLIVVRRGLEDLDIVVRNIGENLIICLN